MNYSTYISLEEHSDKFIVEEFIDNSTKSPLNTKKVLRAISNSMGTSSANVEYVMAKVNCIMKKEDFLIQMEKAGIL